MSTPSTDETLAILTEELEANRKQLAAHRMGIRRATSPGDQLKRSFREHKGLFFGSAAAIGLLLALLPAGQKKSKDLPRRRRENDRTRTVKDIENDEEAKASSHPLIAAAGVTVMKMIWDTARPAILKWLKEKALTHSQTRRFAESQKSPDLMK